MIDTYNEEGQAPLFLASHFKSPPRNFHNTQKVEVDILRDDEDVAVALSSVEQGPRSNEANLFTNKAFTPAIFDEKAPVVAFMGADRRAGQNPFDDPDFVSNATQEAFMSLRLLERKIRRSIELMASQVLQTGIVTLVDKTGAVIYTIDFTPKATHFITTGVTWAEDGQTGDPLKDLADLATVIRRDGKQRPDTLIMGAGATRRFLANQKVIDQADNRRFQMGDINPRLEDQGASFVGRFWIGHYPFDLMQYDGFFRAPGDGLYTSYVDDEKVIMLASQGRLDLTFGSIPMFMGPDQRVLRFLPGQISSADRGMDMTTNTWVTPDGKTLWVSAGTRPLTIPTAIDTFGAIKVTV